MLEFWAGEDTVDEMDAMDGRLAQWLEGAKENPAGAGPAGRKFSERKNSVVREGR